VLSEFDVRTFVLDAVLCSLVYECQHFDALMSWMVMREVLMSEI
jgi:hypothetical protein